MVTRLYLPASSSAPGISPSIWSGWQVGTGSVTRILMSTTKTNTALANSVSAAETSSTPQYVFNGKQFISPAFTIQQGVGGYATSVLRAIESSTNANAVLVVVVRLVDSSGTEKAVLGVFVGSTELTTSNQTRVLGSPGLALAPYGAPMAAVGDRLVVEYGAYNDNTLTNSYTHTLRFGDPTATADFAYTAALTTDLVPWIEFSEDFYGSNVEARVGGSWAEAVLSMNRPEVQIGGAWGEAVLSMNRPEVQIGGAWAEVVTVYNEPAPPASDAKSGWGIILNSP